MCCKTPGKLSAKHTASTARVFEHEKSPAYAYAPSVIWFCWRLVSLGPPWAAPGARDTATCHAYPVISHVRNERPYSVHVRARIPYMYAYNVLCSPVWHMWCSGAW